MRSSTITATSTTQHNGYINNGMMLVSNDDNNNNNEHHYLDQPPPGTYDNNDPMMQIIQQIKQKHYEQEQQQQQQQHPNNHFMSTHNDDEYRDSPSSSSSLLSLLPRSVMIQEDGPLGMMVHSVGLATQVLSVEPHSLAERHGIYPGDMLYHSRYPYEPIHIRTYDYHRPLLWYAIPYDIITRTSSSSSSHSSTNDKPSSLNTTSLLSLLSLLLANSNNDNDNDNHENHHNNNDHHDTTAHQDDDDNENYENILRQLLATRNPVHLANGTNHPGTTNSNGKVPIVKWTDMEIELLRQGIERYGVRDSAPLAKLVGTRTPTQIRRKLRQMGYRQLDAAATGASSSATPQPPQPPQLPPEQPQQEEEEIMPDHIQDYSYVDDNEHHDEVNNEYIDSNHYHGDADGDAEADDDHREVAAITIKTGAWTEEENELLRAGLALYGHSTKLIATMIPTRTMLQIQKKINDMERRERRRSLQQQQRPSQESSLVTTPNDDNENDDNENHNDDNNNNNDGSERSNTPLRQGNSSSKSGGPWKEDELQRLNDAILTYGHSNTNQIVAAVGTRTGKQIRKLFSSVRCGKSKHYIVGISSSSYTKPVDDKERNDHNDTTTNKPTDSTTTNKPTDSTITNKPTDSTIPNKPTDLTTTNKPTASGVWTPEELDRLNEAIRRHGRSDVDLLVQAVGTRRKAQIQQLFSNVRAGKSRHHLVDEAEEDAAIASTDHSHDNHKRKSLSNDGEGNTPVVDESPSDRANPRKKRVNNIWRKDELDRLNDAIRFLNGNRDIPLLAEAVGTRSEEQIRRLFDNVRKGYSSHYIVGINENQQNHSDNDDDDDDEAMTPTTTTTRSGRTVQHRTSVSSLLFMESSELDTIAPTKTPKTPRAKARKWTTEEVQRLNEGIRLFGRKDVTSLVQMVGTRTEYQIRQLFWNVKGGKSSHVLLHGKEEDDDEEGQEQTFATGTADDHHNNNNEAAYYEDDDDNNNEDDDFSLDDE